MWRFRSVVGRMIVGKQLESRRHSTGSQTMNEQNNEFMFESVAHSNSAAHQLDMQVLSASDFFDDAWKPNRQEIALIRRTYPRDEMLKDQIGTEIFSHVFERSPEVLKYFPSFGRYGVKLGLRSDEFLHHMRRFMDVLDFVVDNLHQPQEVHTYLRELGVRHRAFSTASSAFRAYQWRVFGEAIAHAVVTILSNPLPVQDCTDNFGGLSNEQTQQIGFVWGRLGDWIMCSTRDGFREDGLKTSVHQDEELDLDHNKHIVSVPNNNAQIVAKAKANLWFEKTRKRSSKKTKK